MHEPRRLHQARTCSHPTWPTLRFGCRYSARRSDAALATAARVRRAEVRHTPRAAGIGSGKVGHLRWFACSTCRRRRKSLPSTQRTRHLHMRGSSHTSGYRRHGCPRCGCTRNSSRTPASLRTNGSRRSSRGRIRTNTCRCTQPKDRVYSRPARANNQTKCLERRQPTDENCSDTRAQRWLSVTLQRGARCGVAYDARFACHTTCPCPMICRAI